MKDHIKILFFKNLGFPLDGEHLKYIVIARDDGTYQINEAPYSLEGVFSNLIDFLCYDYDELSIYNQIRYEHSYINLKRINVNVYSEQPKVYEKKNNLFT